MSSYRKNENRDPASNSTLRKAIPGVSADNYESVEGLGAFLFGLKLIVEYVQVGNLFADIFSTENELYFRIYNDCHSHIDSMFGSYTNTYALKNLNKNYITQILQDGDELELFVNHNKDGQAIQTKIKITNTGEIIGKQLKPEIVPAPFGKPLNVLKQLNDSLMWEYPDYYEIYDDLFHDSEELLKKESNYESEFDTATRDLVMNQIFQPHFEQLIHLFVKSGIISHNIWSDQSGWYEYEQCFIAFKFNEKLHFYLSPVVYKVEFAKSRWISETRCIINLTYRLHHESDSRQKVTITLDESGIQKEEMTE